jgi:prolyl-tRNA editing enzyme YbaK/EbsC (Cys-tRNA(Pro) deacylase)
MSLLGVWRSGSSERGGPDVSTVIDYLRGRGVPFLVLPTPDATTAEETAERHAIHVDDMVHTVVVANRFGSALMVVPWTRRLDLGLARRAMNDPKVRPATDEELLAKAPEFDPDAWPPLGLFLLMPMFVDHEVADLEQVVFPAGKPTTLVCIQAEELFRDDPVVITALTSASIRREPIGSRRGNLWAIRNDSEPARSGE